MATLYKADGSKEEVHPANGSAFTFQELSALVGGYAARYHLSKYEAMYLYEDAKFEGLPTNTAATVLLGRDLVVGDALVVSREEEGT